jgi:hypothetical protein
MRHVIARDSGNGYEKFPAVGFKKAVFLAGGRKFIRCFATFEDDSVQGHRLTVTRTREWRSAGKRDSERLI